MKIRLNEKLIEIEAGKKISEIRNLYKPDADVIVLNGFPVSNDLQLKDGDELFLIKRGERPSYDELEYMMVARHTPKIHEKLKKASVGIAGVGGLGSNVAIALARVGVGKLIIADFDVVEPSNLNRQQYFIEQIGMLKVDAMRENLSRINPYVNVETFNVKLTENNIPEIFAAVSVIVEAFDRAEAKAMLINTVLEKMPEVKIVAASGLAGYGPNNDIKTVAMTKRLYIVGDFVSEAREGQGLMAPRVGIAAAHQANQVVRIILGEEE
ncbi:MAG: sulfur carrier protein ThiS adenylyltransferase ThiF [bacterium]